MQLCSVERIPFRGIGWAKCACLRRCCSSLCSGAWCYARGRRCRTGRCREAPGRRSSGSRPGGTAAAGSLSPWPHRALRPTGGRVSPTPDTTPQHRRPELRRLPRHPSHTSGLFEKIHTQQAAILDESVGGLRTRYFFFNE
ncbi:unnamed protein product [Ixodes persulcatus]